MGTRNEQRNKLIIMTAVTHKIAQLSTPSNFVIVVNCNLCEINNSISKGRREYDLYKCSFITTFISQIQL